MTPRPQLEQAGHRIGDAFDESERYGPGGQHCCQQYGNERNNDIGGEIVEKTDQAENDYGTRQFSGIGVSWASGLVRFIHTAILA